MLNGYRWVVGFIVAGIAFAGGWVAHRPPQTVGGRAAGVDPRRLFTTAACALTPVYRAQAAADPPRVVMLGDSVTDYMRQQPWWPAFARRHRVGNFAIAGCGSATVLWQVRQGLLDGVNPNLVTVFVGGNDLIQGAEPAAVAGVIRDIVGELHRRLRTARVVVLWPAGGAATGRMSAPMDELGRQLASSCPCEYLPVGRAFVGRPDLLADGYHPTMDGYRLLLDDLTPLVDPPTPAASR